MGQKNDEKDLGIKTPTVILASILGSLFGFATIATLLGVKIDDELNKDYYKSQKQELFKKKIEA